MEEITRMEMAELLNYSNINQSLGNDIGCFPFENSSLFNRETCIYYVDAFSFVLVSKGSARISINNREIVVRPQSLVVLSPNHLTRLIESSNDFMGMHLVIDITFFKSIPQIQDYIMYMVGIMLQKNRSIELTKALFKTLHNDMLLISERVQQNEHLFRNAIIYNALQSFMLNFINAWEKTKQPDNESALTQSRKEILLMQFIELMQKHFKKEHYISFYAEKLCITPQYLSKIVKELLGETVNGMLFKMLYHESERMLRDTDKSIQQITEELHFSDQSSFGKFFKKRSHLSPLQYRKNSV